MKRILFVMIAGLVLSSCAGSRIKPTEAEKREKPYLTSECRIAVAVPGSDTNKQATIAEYVCKEFSKKSANVIPVGKYDDVKNIAEKADYHVSLEVLDYKNRNNMNVFGLRDSILVKVKITDLKTGETIEAQEIRATGRWFAWGEFTPDEWFKKPATEYIATLFK
jgi:hypothetical protein